MNQKKLLILLVGLVLFVNYLNYWQPDRKGLAREIGILESKIDREKRLDTVRIDPEKLALPQTRLFFDGKKLGYSEAMGRLQKSIQRSAKEAGCKVGTLKWAQVPVSGKTYQQLRISFSLRCSPRGFFRFADALRSGDKLLLLKNIGVAPDRKDRRALSISGQIVAYRIANAL